MNVNTHDILAAFSLRDLDPKFSAKGQLTSALPLLSMKNSSIINENTGKMAGSAPVGSFHRVFAVSPGSLVCVPAKMC